MDNTNNNNNSVEATNIASISSTVNHFGSNSGASNNQFDNSNYGVPDKPGYAYIPSQSTEPHVAMPPVRRGATRSSHIIATVLAVMILLSVASIYFSIWNNRSVRIVDSEYVDAYVMIKEIPLTMQYSPDETRAMIKLA